MSVDLIPILIDDHILVAEIMRLKGTLPPEEIDGGLHSFIEALPFDYTSDSNQYAYAVGWKHSNTKYCHGVNERRLKMLVKAQEAIDSETPRSADALYQFFGAFFCSFSTSNPFNEHGFHCGTIINSANAQRLHLLFQKINFELLRPIFNEHCKLQDDGSEYPYIHSFEDLIIYAKALDGLLLQAQEKKKTLYIFVS